MNAYVKFLKKVREAWPSDHIKITNDGELLVEIAFTYDGVNYEIKIDDLVFTTVDGVKQSEVGQLILTADYITREYLLDLHFISIKDK